MSCNIFSCYHDDDLNDNLIGQLISFGRCLILRTRNKLLECLFTFDFFLSHVNDPLRVFQVWQLVTVEATIHICVTCNLFLRSLQVSQQQTPSLVGLADNIDSKTIFTHNLDIFDSEMIF